MKEREPDVLATPMDAEIPWLRLESSEEALTAGERALAAAMAAMVAEGRGTGRRDLRFCCCSFSFFRWSGMIAWNSVKSKSSFARCRPENEEGQCGDSVCVAPRPAGSGHLGTY